MSTFDRHVGTIVDAKYQIERMIGAGGMGAVFLATHVGTERLVALKLISPKFATDATFVERFRREARAAGRLRHPNIVDVTDFGFAEAGGEPLAYLVMEYLDGCSLAEVLDEDPQLPLEWVVDFFDQFASAVDEAHRQGIVHRDLKPANVWLEPNRRGGFTVKVLDFGLARLAERDTVADSGRSAAPRVSVSLSSLDDASEVVTLPMVHPPDTAEQTIPYGSDSIAPAYGSREGESATDSGRDVAGSALADVAASSSRDLQLTRAGTLMGTPPYMSPEQCLGQVAGPSSDIYTLGVIVYEMLAGRTPFTGDLASLLYKHTNEKPRALDDVVPGIPRRVSDVVMAALSKDPAARPASAGLFAAALRAKSESWRKLLRQTVVTCADHYLLFLRISFFALLPYLIVRVLEVAGMGLQESGALSETVAGIATFPLLLLTLVTSFLSSVVSRGVATMVLAQLLLAPLRRARVRVAVAAIRQRMGAIVRGALAGFFVVLGPLFVSIIAIGFAIFFGLMAFGVADEQWVGPAAAAVLCAFTTLVALALLYYALRQIVRYQLFPVVLLVEDLKVREALRRSRKLAQRSMRDVASVTVVTFLPVLIMSIVSSTIYRIGGLTGGSLAARTVDLIGAVPIMLLADPFVSVLNGLLYLKLRQTEGERIEDILNRQFADEDVPKRRWQRVLSSGAGATSYERAGGRSNDS